MDATPSPLGDPVRLVNQLDPDAINRRLDELERERDALEQTGVRVIIIWEGTNDIGEHPDMTARQLIHGYLQLIAAAHARGIAVVGATLQPDKGAGYYIRVRSRAAAP